ncbi:hypothetical protein [Streptococcus equinus]|uniref:Uncharacterized protein n=1 Tax=Streptococcus equinus TaxID=1335 RepID=A0AAE8HJG0_STREI|nr:hypothetical protein [Streptococcus equinus]QBX08082.1 hypothetical protein JavanS218_0006 [Streptococcus satellite phage Javan218]SDW15054.1 hypothetical protein SAMN05216415_0115 [Streptococcus equinus]
MASSFYDYDDLLVDYEGLCGELEIITDVLELARDKEDEQTILLLHTVTHALKHIVSEHKNQASDYRKKLATVPTIEV